MSKKTQKSNTLSLIHISTNGKLERVEIYRKDVEKTNIQIVYRIRVINSGEVEGAVTIEDKLPEGMNLVNNDGTWDCLLYTSELEAMLYLLILI